MRKKQRSQVLWKNLFHLKTQWGGGGCYAGSATHIGKNAFTLAEVLITLGIIGIVAAMTLPTLIQKHKEQETVAKVKKFYSVISQAIMLARVEHGDVDTWDFAGTTTGSNAQSNTNFANYIKPHLQIIKDCQVTPDKKCVQEGYTSYLNGTPYTNTDYNENIYYKMILKDGSLFWLRTNGEGCHNSDAATDNVCALIWYDANANRPPYTLGKDVFVFFVFKDAVVPHSNDDCSIDSHGWGCSRYILEHGDMGYLH